MKVKILSVLICFLLVNPCLAQENKSIAKSESNGKIKGTVFDTTGEAVMPGRKIVIEGIGIKQEIFTDDSGEYEFDLPSGIYKITIEEKRHYEWFYPFRRGEVGIQSNTKSVVNLYPSIIGKIIALVASTSGVCDEVTVITKPPKYETVSLTSGSPFNLVIQFNKKRIHKTITEYDNATLSYNNLTIIAQRISYDRSSSKIKAEGFNEKVLVDNNGNRNRANKVNIEFRNGLPIIQ